MVAFMFKEDDTKLFGFINFLEQLEHLIFSVFSHTLKSSCPAFIQSQPARVLQESLFATTVIEQEQKGLVPGVLELMNTELIGYISSQLCIQCQHIGN